MFCYGLPSPRFAVPLFPFHCPRNPWQRDMTSNEGRHTATAATSTTTTTTTTDAVIHLCKMHHCKLTVTLQAVPSQCFRYHDSHQASSTYQDHKDLRDHCVLCTHCLQGACMASDGTTSTASRTKYPSGKIGSGFISPAPELVAISADPWCVSTSCLC